MSVRKNFRFLSTTERNAFFEALLKLKNNIVNPAAPAADRYSVYDCFVSLHWSVFGVRQTPASFPSDVGHGGPAFLAWHRILLRKFEQALQAEVPGVMLPYWDWSPAVFTPTWMGPDGGPGGAGGGIVETGWFAPDRPGTGTNTVALPAWYPATFNGWRIRPDLDDSGQGTRLRRFFGQSDPDGPGPFPFDVLPTASDVNTILTRTTAGSFRTMLEEGSATVSSHNEVHRYVGGHMVAACSPNDPIFWLHHCNIDRLWAMWQLDGHGGTAWYPVSSSFGHQLTSLLWPWTGATSFTALGAPAYYLSFFAGAPAVTATDMINHHALGAGLGGYAYDTEPVLGIALDRSFSMTGPTTDPFAGMSPTTKWELAKLGVQHLLTDCEAVYAAREAYVIGGVNTFTTSGIGNVVDPVIAGTPYGLIKAGGPYTQAAVTAALGALSPTGATPLGAALSETYSEVVRPAANAEPAGDVRYMAVLTDGKETVAPWLSSIMAGQFSDTIIFGMGFGSGSDWNGVDYPTINSIVAKGRTAPVGVTQVFMGENIGAIDTFYTKTLAKVIGYTPILDPRFDLFPGEHVHLSIWATSADESFLITVFRGDENLDHWHVGVIAPDGRTYDDAAPGPYFITTRRNGHRDTIIVMRNGAPHDRWCGQWFLHLSYGAHGGHGHGHGDDIGGLMVMPSLWDLAVPASAPPLRGPVFANFNTAAAERLSTRFIPLSARSAIPSSLGGTVLAARPDDSGPNGPSSVVVQVYAKTNLHARLRVEDGAHFAGDALRLALEIEPLQGGDVSHLHMLGRLVAPTRAASAALLDRQTILVARRKRYVVDAGGRKRFDAARYFADYERKKPGTFAVRDEKLALEPAGPRTFKAAIGGTEAAGVYRAGVYVDGIWTSPSGRRERFARLLTVEVPLGIRLDPQSSRPALSWLAPDHLAVTFTGQDRFGNVIPPGSVDEPSLLFHGRALKVEHEDLFDGTHRLHVRLRGGKDLGVAADGCTLTAPARCDCVDGEVELPANQPLRLSLLVKGQLLPVRPQGEGKPAEGTGGQGGQGGGGGDHGGHDHSGHEH